MIPRDGGTAHGDQPWTLSVAAFRIDFTAILQSYYLGLHSSIPVAAKKGRQASSTSFPGLLQRNRNYRYTWLGQIVSEIGDHFNTIAVFSLVLERTGSGLVVSGIMLARAVPMILAGPIAGVLLDRMDRKQIMLWSDLARAIVAVLFVFAVGATTLGYFTCSVGC